MKKFILPIMVVIAAAILCNGEITVVPPSGSGTTDNTKVATNNGTAWGLTLHDPTTNVDLTASTLLYLDANKVEKSASTGTSMSFSGGSLNTIQDIRTSASPTFAGLTDTGTGAFAGTVSLPNLYVTNASFCLQTNLQPSSQSTNFTPDLTKHVFYILATNNIYLSTPTSIPAGGTNITYTFIIQQDGTGSRTLRANNTYWKFPGGTVPTLTTATNTVDILTFIVNAQGTALYGTSALNMQ